ncbi:MAG: hypothetical protein U0802_24645 [Candidatus Binatia bacterium]
MTRRIVALLLTLAVVAATLSVPRPARASNNLEYIIPAAVGGAVALVAIIAILMADRSEPEYELVPSLPRRQPQGGVHLAPACAPNAQGLPLLCW